MKYFLSHQPQSKNRVTQKFSARPGFYAQFWFKGHEGIDINDTPGVPTPVYAVEDWLITIQEWGAYWKRINLKYKNLLFSYCHLSKIHVKQGDKVKAWDIIGMTWDTASYDMPIHLHFMVVELDENWNVLNKWNWYKGSIKIESTKKIGWEIFIHITKPVHNPDMYKSMQEYRGLKVKYKEQPKTAPTRNGFYNPFEKSIIIYPNFFTQILPKQRAILDHEFCHHVQYFRLTYNYIKTFKKIHEYDWVLIWKFNERSSEDFDWKKFINSHAQKSWTEDMAEQIELRVLIEEWVAELPEEWTLLNKYRLACIMYDRYKNIKDRHRDVDKFIERFINEI